MRRYDGILCMDFRRSRIEESVQLGRVAWKTGGPRGGGADKIRDKAFQDRASVSEPPRSNNFRLNFQKKIQKKHLQKNTCKKTSCIVRGTCDIL